jgi:hypothetical protein
MLLVVLQFLMLVLVLLHIVGVVSAGVAFAETDCKMLLITIDVIFFWRKSEKSRVTLSECECVGVCGRHNLVRRCFRFTSGSHWPGEYLLPKL